MECIRNDVRFAVYFAFNPHPAYYAVYSHGVELARWA